MYHFVCGNAPAHHTTAQPGTRIQNQLYVQYKHIINIPNPKPKNTERTEPK